MGGIIYGNAAPSHRFFQKPARTAGLKIVVGAQIADHGKRAKLSALNQRAGGPVLGNIALHMAHLQKNSVFFAGLVHPEAGGVGNGHGFFQQDMDSFFRTGQNTCFMQAVGKINDHKLQLFPLQHFFIAFISVRAIGCGRLLRAAGRDIRHGRQARVGVARNSGQMACADDAGADHTNGEHSDPRFPK